MKPKELIQYLKGDLSLNEMSTNSARCCLLLDLPPYASLASFIQGYRCVGLLVCLYSISTFLLKLFKKRD